LFLLLVTILAMPILASSLTAYIWTLLIGSCRYFENTAAHPLASFRLGIVTALLTVAISAAGLVLPFNEELTLILAGPGSGDFPRAHTGPMPRMWLRYPPFS
jgi:hypothetical protein